MGWASPENDSERERTRVFDMGFDAGVDWCAEMIVEKFTALVGRDNAQFIAAEIRSMK